jgi:hypothetical protein
MSSDPSSNSIYGIDSSSSVPESSSDDSEMAGLYSKVSKACSESSESDSCSTNPACQCGNHHPPIHEPNPFMFNGNYIQYNFTRGITAATSVFFTMLSKAEQSLANVKEALVVRKLYALKQMMVGPVPLVNSGAALDVNGDVVIRNNLQVHGNINVDTITANTIISGDFTSKSVYLTAGTGGNSLIINPSDGIDLVYANPSNGNVTVFLGTGATGPSGTTGPVFPSNYQITIKDVSLEAVTGTTGGNVYITAPVGAQIETYLSDGTLVASENGSYVLNTNGGSVSFRYFNYSEVGMATWIIISQYLGNQRQ